MFKNIFALALLLFSVSTACHATLNGLYTVNPSGSATSTNYKTLASALSDIKSGTRTDGGLPNGAGVTGAVVFELAANSGTSGVAYAFTPITGASKVNTVTIRPSASITGDTIKFTHTSTTFAVTGHYYIFDGRPGGSGSNRRLSIASTGSSTASLSFTGAKGNVTKYCLFAAQNLVTTNGALLISNNADSNIITYCHIDGKSLSRYTVFALGTASNINNNNAISYCDIFNFSGSANGVGAGINSTNYNTDMVIEGNSIYQTANVTGVTGTYIGISVSSNSMVTMTNNFIGGSAPQCAGNKMSIEYTAPGGTTTACYFYGIQVSNSTGNNAVIYNNKISNINLTYNNTTSGSVGGSRTPVSFSGISCSGGLSTITNNIIGGRSGIDSIVVTKIGGLGGCEANISGIVSVSQAAEITNNVIGSLNATSNSATGSVINSVTGINFSSTAGMYVAENTIGDINTANSIYTLTTSSPGNSRFSIAYGISQNARGAIVKANNIANITSDFYAYGIYVNPGGGNRIEHNTIRNLYGPQISRGITQPSSPSDTLPQYVNNNIIYGLRSEYSAIGVYFQQVGNQSIISGNNIHSLVAIRASGSYFGIQVVGTGNVDVINNMVRLGYNNAGANVDSGLIYGIYESNTASAANVKHNTVYVGGVNFIYSGNYYSFYTLASNPARTIANNIFANNRISAVLANQAAFYATSAITNTVLNNNIYTYAGTYGRLARRQSTSYSTLPSWIAATNKDANSIVADPLFVNATGDSSKVDLHVRRRSPAEGAGMAGAGVMYDIDSQLRSSFTPHDIGADAGNFVQRWTGNTNTDWHTAANWATNVLPLNSDLVIIPAVANKPEISSNAVADELVIDTGSSVTITGANTLTVSGNVTNNGTITGSGNTILNGSNAQKIYGTGFISNLELNNAAGATIDTGAKLSLTGIYKPAAGVLTTNGKLVLKSIDTATASIAAGNASGGYIDGNVTMERYIPGGRRAYRFLGNPFSTAISLSQLTDDIDITGAGGATNGFTTTNTNNPSAYYYNTAMSNGNTALDSGWQPFASATAANWAPQQGIRVLVRGAKGEGVTSSIPYTPSPVTLDMTGPVNQGTQVISMVKAAKSGLNLIANPFPSPIMAGPALAAASNIQGTAYYVWDPTSQGANGKGAYELYIKHVLATDVIPSGCAILVRVKANTSVTFSETDKADTPTLTAFKTTAIGNLVNLLITDTTGAYYDRLYLMDEPTAADTLENADGEKIDNPNTNFYARSANGVKLGVDARSYTDGKIIPLGFTSVEQKTYVLRVKDNTMASGTDIYLHDKYLNTKTLLTQSAQYSFAVTADTLSQGNNRFELGIALTSQVNQVQNVATQKLHVTAMPNPANNYVDISINAATEAKTMITIYDLKGSVVYKQQAGVLQQQTVRIPLSELNAGMYLIQVQHGKDVVNGRIIKQ